MKIIHFILLHEPQFATSYALQVYICFNFCHINVIFLLSCFVPFHSHSIVLFIYTHAV